MPVIDGCRLSRANFRIFRHQIVPIRTAATAEMNRPTLIITQRALQHGRRPCSLASVAEHICGLYVDDAHGTGIMGPTGRGTIEQWSGTDPFHMGTLSKHWEPWAYIVGPQPHLTLVMNVTRRSFLQQRFHPRSRRRLRLQSRSFSVNQNVGCGSGRIDNGCSMECSSSVFG